MSDLLHLWDPLGIFAVQQPRPQQGRAPAIPKRRALRVPHRGTAGSGLVLLRAAAGSRGRFPHAGLQR